MTASFLANKGAGGVDGMGVEELGVYIRDNKDIIVQSIRNRTDMPKPVRRVYIPKDNGKKRPLGIQFDHESIYKVENSRLGWYKQSGMNVVNFIISPIVLLYPLEGIISMTP